ncbi:hypothetical protein H9Y04_15975 [Streptomyces sp. TRM66268-LWL]|uniref:Uncharacterized protein n=1 Tax=Streptomyces polyasparticus TaxID=2767826 RepID=A0ABR7SF75_9ACTN|nr:hypothetical protein [Streptomyces polyasparticus]MBC9714063.1 hypothetical protein [Streptomyces polyasparticus]
MGTEEHNRRAIARQGLTPPSAADHFKEQMLTIMGEYEERRRTEIIAAGGDPDEDRDPFEQVRNIADDYTRHKDSGPEALADLLDLLATDVLSLRDVRDIRLAAEAAAAITPRLIRSARDNGQPVPSIAADLGMTESYVYRQLRKPKTEATPDQ